MHALKGGTNTVHLLKSTFNKCLRLQKCNTTHLWIKKNYAAWGRKHMCLLDELIHGKDVGVPWCCSGFKFNVTQFQVDLEVHFKSFQCKYMELMGQENSLHFCFWSCCHWFSIVKRKKSFGLIPSTTRSSPNFLNSTLGRPPSHLMVANSGKWRFRLGFPTTNVRNQAGDYIVRSTNQGKMHKTFRNDNVKGAL